MKNDKIVSRSLSKLSVLMDFDTSSTQSESLERKRLLAVIIHVIGPEKCCEHSSIEHAYKTMTGETLLPNETDKAVGYLMREKAPSLSRILSGTGRSERRNLLKAAVFTWSTHGMDSDHSTKVTEQIVQMLGFDQDDICKTLDRLWVKERTRLGVSAVAHASYAVLRNIVKALRFAAAQMAPHAKHLGIRALASLQR
ncbi:MAG: hypothetical protein HKN27_17395 [Silicimonas sp.]|nr:hypothetical protein [Silicimonas sp.]